MLHEPRSRDLALAAHDARRLDAVLAALAQAPGLTPTRRRDLASAVRRVASAIGHTPETTPADPGWLRPRLRRVVPAALGISAKTWTNVISDFRAALQIAGIRAIRERAEATGFPPAWATLHTALPCRRCRIGLARFMRFCANVGLDPAQVDDETLGAFRTTIAAAELRKDPEQLARDVAVYWNRAASLVADWPTARLTVVDRRNRVALPISEFAPSFRTDLDAYLSAFAAPDITDPYAPPHPLAGRTIESRLGIILRFAAALVRGGRDPATLQSLDDLVEPATVREGLRALMTRTGGKPRLSHHETALVLRSIAKWRVKVAPGVLNELSDIVRRVRPNDTGGMTAKNRARLRQFDESAAIGTLLRLPDLLVRRTGREADAKRAARLMEMAVAIALLIHCPMRIQNLRQLDLRRHLVGRPGGPRRIVIPAEEVKNRRELDYPLTQELARLIERFAREHRYVLNAAPGDLLFPQRRTAQPVDRAALGKAITKTIRDETGLEVNPHLFRHIGAKIFLREQPGAYEAVRRLLAHSETSSTIDAYAGFETDAAVRAYSRIIEGAAATASVKRRRS